MIRSTHGRRTERGTSLLEVVVTAALLAGGVLATVSVLDGVRTATASVDRRSTALGLARESLEALRATSFVELGLSSSREGFEPSFDRRDTVIVESSRIEPRQEMTIDGSSFVVRRFITWDEARLSSGSVVPGAWKRLTVIVEFDGGTRQVRLDGGQSPLSAGPDCLTPSTDVAREPLEGVINTYLGGRDVTPTGATVVSVIDSYGRDEGPPIRTGDLVLIMQMTSKRGDNAGLFEYAMATGEASNGRLPVTGRGLGGGLVNSYGDGGQFQVVRVPSYGAVVTGSGLTALPWDGKTGGVLAFDALGGLTVGADLSVSGLGAADQAYPGVRRSSSIALLGKGGGDSDRAGGGIIAVRTSAIDGGGLIEANGRKDGGGGTVIIAAERDDLSDLKVLASGQGLGEGGSVLASGSIGGVDVSGSVDGFVDTTINANNAFGLPPGPGCLPAVNVTVSTSTPAVPRGPGVVVAYHLVVTNAAGRGVAENLEVQDFLPTGFGVQSTSWLRLNGGASRSPANDPRANVSDPTWSRFTLPGGSSIEIYLTATVPSARPPGQLDNDAIARYTAQGLPLASAFAGNSTTTDDVVILP